MSDVLGPLGAMGFFVWIIWMVSVTWRRTKVVKAQTQVRGQILEKINSGGEMLEFMKTEAGQKLLEPLPVEPVEPATPRGYARILKAVQAGIILTVLGAGFLAVSNRIGEQDVEVIGVVVLALGLGFLLAGAASYMLSKNWGLIEDREAE